jgi:hypothetical protein
MDYNVEQLVDDIFKRNNLSTDECLNDKLKEYIDNIFDKFLRECDETIYKSSSKKIIDKVYNRLSSSKFKYWVAGSYSYSHPECMNLLFTSSKHNCLIEVNYKIFKNKMERYENRWGFSIPNNCKFTPLEILAIYMILDKNNSNTMISAIRETVFYDESKSKDVDMLKKIFFACLEISLDELFSENEYQKIYI